MENTNIRVVELFAGVGGFRLGLEKANKRSKKGNYRVVWSNQWEPSTKRQHASEVYEARFGDHTHSNEDIADVPTDLVPDHDLLVGGFPCQDYSVATTLRNAKGLIGKKGVLWWSIHRILSEKALPPRFLLLENVDRLLKSPAHQRGRDFAIILKSLSDLGYAVEWRVINAADYGMPQRRRRIFIVAYLNTSKIFKQLVEEVQETNAVPSGGILALAFPYRTKLSLFHQSFTLEGDLVSLSEHFNQNTSKDNSPFENSGFMYENKVFTQNVIPSHQGHITTIGDILEQDRVADSFYISEDDLPKWKYFKGAKQELRKSKNGHSYHYSEGAMIFPDALDKPSRTIITGEGGASPSRFKHVVETPHGIRRLTPKELERLNMFPDDHTKLEGITDAKRAFFMGNALVVGIVERIGEEFLDALFPESP